MKLLTILFALLMPLAAHAQSGCDHQTRTIALPDPVSGRAYEITVSLPDGFDADPSRRWPVVVLADGGRAFPHLACIGRTLAREGQIGIDPVIVGLSYALGEDLENSRRRDYTPVPRAGSSLAYGGAAAYQTYLRSIVLPRVEAEFRTDPAQRIFWGHSYGGLFGAHILLTEPALFQTYLIGSPSFWYENGVINAYEDVWAKRNAALKARVFMYVGGKEVAVYDAARKGNTRDMVTGMHEFEARLRARNYKGLMLLTTIIEGGDHRSAVRPGFEWAMRASLARD